MLWTKNSHVLYERMSKNFLGKVFAINFSLRAFHFHTERGVEPFDGQLKVSELEV